MGEREVEARRTGYGPGWDRQSPWTLRFVDPGLERAYLATTAVSGRMRFRVGINTGPALVGNIGSAELRNFSALGDATNTAARLQTYAKAGSVVIGESTYEFVRDVAHVRSLGAPDLKGRSVPTAVYELLDLGGIVGSRSAGGREVGSGAGG